MTDVRHYAHVADLQKDAAAQVRKLGFGLEANSIALAEDLDQLAHHAGEFSRFIETVRKLAECDNAARFPFPPTPRTIAALYITRRVRKARQALHELLVEVEAIQERRFQEVWGES